MRRSVLFGLIFLTAVCSARAQVAPAASGRRLEVFAGGEGSAFQPDINPDTGIVQSSPYRLYGVGGFADVDFSRWVTIEGEGRWLRWNQHGNVTQDTYLIGPRVPIGDFHGFTPYGKFLFGFGSGPFLTGRATAWTYGGGVDYRLGQSKFTVRCFDFEFQDWRVAPTSLHPYGGSIGIAYKVF